MKIEITERAADDLMKVLDQALRANGIGVLNMVNEVVPQIEEYRKVQEKIKETQNGQEKNDEL